MHRDLYLSWFPFRNKERKGRGKACSLWDISTIFIRGINSTVVRMDKYSRGVEDEETG